MELCISSAAYSLRSLLLPSQGRLHRPPDGALGGELLPDHAVLVQRAADLLRSPAHSTLLCWMLAYTSATWCTEGHTGEGASDGAVLVKHLGLGRGRGAAQHAAGRRAVGRIRLHARVGGLRGSGHVAWFFLI